MGLRPQHSGRARNYRVIHCGIVCPPVHIETLVQQGWSIMDAVQESRARLHREARRVRKMIAVERDAANREEKTGRIGPTPERQQKKKDPDAIARLVSSGFLDSDDERALTDIASAYASITGAVACSTSSISDRVDQNPATAIQEGHLGQQMRYREWWRELGRTGERDCFVFVIDLAVYGLSISKMSGRHNVTRRTASNRLRDGLGAYHAAMRSYTRR